MARRAMLLLTHARPSVMSLSPTIIREFITGFRKRKEERRKEAAEKQKRKELEARKQARIEVRQARRRGAPPRSVGTKVSLNAVPCRHRG